MEMVAIQLQSRPAISGKLLSERVQFSPKFRHFRAEGFDLRRHLIAPTTRRGGHGHWSGRIGGADFHVPTEEVGESFDFPAASWGEHLH